MKKIILSVLFYLVTLVTTGCNPCADADPSGGNMGTTDIIATTVYPGIKKSGIYAFSSDGSDMKLIRDNSVIFSAPQAGKMAYISNKEEVVVSDMDGGNPKTIYRNILSSNELYFAILSPDGQYILFLNNITYEGISHLWIIKTDGSGLRRVSSTPVPEMRATFSPNSLYIAYPTVDSLLHIQSVNGTEDKVIAYDAMQGGDGAGSISWSSQDRIAYVTQHVSDAQHNLVTPNQIAIIDRSDLHKTIINRDKKCLSPTWSPDGSTLCFTCNDGNIYTVQADGTSLTSIVSKAGFAFVFPSWSKDGSKILFTQQSIYDLDEPQDRQLKYYDTQDKSVKYVGSSTYIGFWKN